MEKKIKIAHLGLGHMHSLGKMQCVRKYPEIFEIVGYAEPNAELISKWKDHSVFEDLELLDMETILSRSDIDAVMVECDDSNLAEYAALCISAGKHIHMDKPAGEDIDAFKKIMQYAKSKSLTVQMAYMYRYNPAIIKSLEMVNSGMLGDIIDIDAVMSTEHTDKIRRWLSQFKGGTMHTFGCHIIDLLLIFQGMPQKVVPYKKKTMLREIEVYDNDFAVFEYPKGISTVRTSSYEINGYGRRQLVIRGTQGTIEIKPLETNINEDYTRMYLSTAKDTAEREYYDTKTKVDIAPITGRYDTMMLDFAKMVRGEKENPYTYEHELKLQRLCLAACGFDINIKETVKI